MRFCFNSTCIFSSHQQDNVCLYHVVIILNIICFKEKYDETIKACSKAIEINPAYVKALSRRGEAHEKLEHFEEAIHGKLCFAYVTLKWSILPAVVFFRAFHFVLELL